MLVGLIAFGCLIVGVLVRCWVAVVCGLWFVVAVFACLVCGFEVLVSHVGCLFAVIGCCNG